ncbi:BamA/TamA family outer membrane protein [Algivirga pacifica]|uniref:BamA/TamA family outer membrane protein n=1 Tax=Algivirga pacifica TaxID=1162670 RepID=A0ABP9D432_9BACT
MKKTLLLVVGMLVAGMSFAQEATPDSTATANDTYKTKYTFLPYAIYAPETSVEGGVLILRQFKPKGAGADTRPSNIEFNPAYTLNNQWKINLKHTYIAPGEKWITTGRFTLRKFPEKYFGIGNNTSDAQERRVDWTAAMFTGDWAKQVKPGMFAGVQVKYNRYMNVMFEDCLECNDEQLGEVIPGEEGGTAAGIGLIYKWDLRNSVMTPVRGHYLEVSTLHHGKATLSDYGFSSLKLDARKYFDFSSAQNGGSVLAMQAMGQFTFGDAPFRELAMLGGDGQMRGYYFGRYRDDHYVTAQVEYRQDLFWRFGATAFATVGNVGNSVENMMENIKGTVGAGLRLNMNKKDRAHLRLDYAVGNGTSGLYMTFGEAF